VIPAGRFDRIEGFSDGLFVVGKLKPKGSSDYRFDHTFGYANEKGELVIDYKFVEAHPFSEGLAKASVGTSYEDATWGYIDKKGNWVIPPQFGYAENFQEGLAYTYLKSKTATAGEVPLTKPKFIDKAGKTVIETEIPGMLTNEVGYFKNGLTPTVQNGRVGFIDRTGKTAVPFRYDGIFGIGPSMYQENFKDGITRTAKGDYEFYIDTQGNEYRMPAPMALVNAPSGLKMRQKPDAKATIVLSIDNKSEVEILETTSQKETIEQKTANWLKVKYGNQEGYVFGGFLLKGYRAIAPSGLSVRTTPATTGNKVGSVDINEMVYLLEKTTQQATIEGKTAHWLKVRYQSFNQEGRVWLEGYVFGGFVEAP
jgi:WG containing repeat/Bacterial SH3 domain